MTFFGTGWAEFHGGKVPGKIVGVTTTVRCKFFFPNFPFFLFYVLFFVFFFNIFFGFYFLFCFFYASLFGIFFLKFVCYF